MKRTNWRPLARYRLPAWHVPVISLVLNAAAFLVFPAWANLAAARPTMIGSVVYVFVYTVWLKRISAQMILIGGSAGAIPPLVGWAATGALLDLTALALFLVVLLRTPPRFLVAR
jgi:protoheme IX farnesyltransferase